MKLELAAMECHQALDDRQAQARTLFGALDGDGTLAEGRQHHFEFVLRNAGPVVIHIDRQAAVAVGATRYLGEDRETVDREYHNVFLCTFDADGRMWVLEMPGFMSEPGGANSREKQIPTGAFGTTFNDPGTQSVDGRQFADLRYTSEPLHDVTLTGRAFYDGVRYHGTYIYGGGENEKLIAKLLADRRDEVTLATKFGIQGNPADRAAGRIGVRGDAAYVRQSIDESLQRRRGKRILRLVPLVNRRRPKEPVGESSGVRHQLANGGRVHGLLELHTARRIDAGDEIEIEQGAEIGRPSLLAARVEGSRERITKVEVGGHAVVVARGEFRLDT